MTVKPDGFWDLDTSEAGVGESETWRVSDNRESPLVIKWVVTTHQENGSTKGCKYFWILGDLHSLLEDFLFPVHIKRVIRSSVGSKDLR